MPDIGMTLDLSEYIDVTLLPGRVYNFIGKCVYDENTIILNSGMHLSISAKMAECTVYINYRRVEILNINMYFGSFVHLYSTWCVDKLKKTYTAKGASSVIVVTGHSSSNVMFAKEHGYRNAYESILE